MTDRPCQVCRVGVEDALGLHSPHDPDCPRDGLCACDNVTCDDHCWGCNEALASMCEMCRTGVHSMCSKLVRLNGKRGPDCPCGCCGFCWGAGTVPFDRRKRPCPRCGGSGRETPAQAPESRQTGV